MTAPAVAQQKREDALAAFRKKNSVLHEVVKGTRRDTLPSRLSDLAYSHWASTADGVERFSTFTFYNDKNETERNAAMKGLKALGKLRRAVAAKNASKAVTVNDLKKELKAEKGRSKSFAKQYNEQAKLNKELIDRVRQLEQDLSRANKDLSQVRPLRSARPPQKGVQE
jgi:hypothetical protein